MKMVWNVTSEPDITRRDESIIACDVREGLGHFRDAGAFEAAVERLEDAGISRNVIHMIARRDAVRQVALFHA
jgi:hypothetical protein